MDPSNRTIRAVGARVFSAIGSLGAAALLSLVSAGIGAQEGSADAGQQKSVTCSACHGIDGNSVNTIWPSLAGQHERYLVRQLEAFVNQERSDVGMQQYAAALSEQDMHDVAAYFAAQRIAPKGTDPGLVERGQRIYRAGIPEREVPACIACHGPTGHGNPLAGYPSISHQHSDYLAKTLRDYRTGSRTSDTELNQMMRNVAELLLDDEIDALASYMQGLN